VGDKLFFDDRSGLHDELDALEFANVSNGIAGDSDDVGIFL
jgi:hypothetical protein